MIGTRVCQAIRIARHGVGRAPECDAGGGENDGGATATPTSIYCAVDDLEVAVNRVAPVLTSASRQIKANAIGGGIGMGQRAYRQERKQGIEFLHD